MRSHKKVSRDYNSKTFNKMLETIQDQQVAIDIKLEQKMKETEETLMNKSSDDVDVKIMENVVIDETSKEHCLSEHGEEHDHKRDVAIDAHLDE